jgi:hypothetical protein
VSDLRRVARRSGISKAQLKSKGIDFDQRGSDDGILKSMLLLCLPPCDFWLQKAKIRAILLAQREQHRPVRALALQSAAADRINVCSFVLPKASSFLPAPPAPQAIQILRLRMRIRSFTVGLNE